MSKIKNWIKGTGSYEVKEIALKQGDLLDVNTLSQWTNPSPRVLVAGPIITQWNRCYFTQLLGAEKRYRINYTVNSIDGPFVLAPPYPASAIRTLTTPGNYIDEFIILDSTHKLSFFPSLADTNVNITINSIVEIPPLPTITTGTKYLECTSNGTITINADLDSFTDNGYIEIDRYDGSSWTRYESTVSDLSTNESWFNYSNKKITLTGTTGDRFANLKIYNGVKQ